MCQILNGSICSKGWMEKVTFGTNWYIVTLKLPHLGKIDNSILAYVSVSNRPSIFMVCYQFLSLFAHLSMLFRTYILRGLYWYAHKLIRGKVKWQNKAEQPYSQMEPVLEFLTISNHRDARFCIWICEIHNRICILNLHVNGVLQWWGPSRRGTKSAALYFVQMLKRGAIFCSNVEAWNNFHGG